jgi:hypothetical protein
MILKNKENKLMGQLGLQAPWITIWNYVKVMFAKDESVRVSSIEKIPSNSIGRYEFDIIATDNDKAAAIKDILKQDYDFGNVALHINVGAGTNIFHDVDSNKGNGEIEIDDFKRAFKENPAIDEILEIVDIAGITHYYVMFKREVVSFFNDDLTDPFGAWNGIYEDIAKEIFVDSSICFTTQKEEV